MDKLIGSLVGWVAVVAAFVALYAAFIALAGWLLATAWAAVAVPVFGWKALSLMQAVWLIVGLNLVAGLFRTAIGPGSKS